MSTSDRPEWITSAAAERISGVKRTSLEALKGAGVVRVQNRKVNMNDVAALASWKDLHEYVKGRDRVDFNRRVGFAVPLSDPELTPDLELSEGHDAEEARRGLREQGITLGEDQFLSGWWGVRQEMVDRLVADNAPILGVIGGFVTSGGFITGLAATRLLDARRAFIVRRMTHAELEKYRGTVTKINQTGTYVQLPDSA